MILSVIIALSLDQHIYKGIIKTKSETELNTLVEMLEKNEKYKTGCTSELIKKQFPLNCMSFLKLIEDSKYSKKIKLDKAKSLLKKHCLNKDLSFEFSKPPSNDGLKSTFPNCYKRYSEKFKDNEYKKSKGKWKL